MCCVWEREAASELSPWSSVYCRLCREAFPIPMATGGGTQIGFPWRTLSIKQPRGFGFPPSRRRWWGSLWDRSCPGTPEPAHPSRVWLPSTPLFLLKMTKTIKKRFGATFEGDPIPPSKAAVADGRAGGAWLPSGAWVRCVPGQPGRLWGSSLQWHPAEPVLRAGVSKVSLTPFLCSSVWYHTFRHKAYFHHFSSTFQDVKQLLFFLWSNEDIYLQPLLAVHLATFSPWIFHLLSDLGPGRG